MLLCCLLCVNFIYLKWTTWHDYCPQGVLHGFGLPVVPGIDFHKDGLFKWLMTNFLSSKSDLDVATVSGIWMPKKIYLQKHNRTNLYHCKLTNTHDSGITSRHKIAHNSCQWCEVMFFNSIFTRYDNSSSTIWNPLGNKHRWLTRG